MPVYILDDLSNARCSRSGYLTAHQTISSYVYHIVLQVPYLVMAAREEQQRLLVKLEPESSSNNSNPCHENEQANKNACCENEHPINNNEHPDNNYSCQETEHHNNSYSENEQPNSNAYNKNEHPINNPYSENEQVNHFNQNNYLRNQNSCSVTEQPLETPLVHDVKMEVLQDDEICVKQEIEDEI